LIECGAICLPVIKPRVVALAGVVIASTATRAERSPQARCRGARISSDY
jgi:hypothetical protein